MATSGTTGPEPLALAFDDLSGTAARTYAAKGLVRLSPILLEADAKRLEAELRTQTGWHQHVNQNEKLFELSRETRRNMPKSTRIALDEAVYRNATNGFQFRFEGLRVSEDPADWGNSLLHRFVASLNSEAALAMFRHLTGADDIAIADAQATLYSPGDFLTAHDDDVAGKNRRAAYVYSLNPVWRADWGGLLQLEQADSSTLLSLVPGWNRMTVFRVPQVHNVSLVSPAAAFPRLSITGWLRALGEVA